MTSTINEIFEEVIPYMPETLVSKEVISLFKKLSERFPEGLATGALFECPMGIAAPLSDISIPVTPKGREIIAGRIEGVEIDKSLLKSPVWKRIHSFCEKWLNQEDYKNTGKLWLEFDLESLQEEIPIPGVFIIAQISPEKDLSSHKLDRYKWLIEGLECIRGRPLEKEIRDNLIFCLDAIPTWGSLDFAGLMLSRPLNAVRVVLSIPRQDLKDYLAHIKYPGEGQELEDLVTELSQFTELRYNLDISHEVLPRIGMECSLKDKQKACREKWEEFMTYLGSRSLCIQEKRDALLDWPGHTYVTPHEDREPYYLFRKICHVKITYEKGHPVTCKAYPEFTRMAEIDLLLNKLAESCDTL